MSRLLANMVKRWSEVDVINHGKQTHWIGDVALVPGVVRLDKSVWQDIKGNSTVQTLLEDGQLEVRNKLFGTSKDGKKRKEYSNLGYRNFARERNKPPTPEGAKDAGWLRDQVEMLLNLPDSNVKDKSGAIAQLASRLGMSETEIARKI